MDVRHTPHPLDVYCGGGSAKSVGLHGGGVGLGATSLYMVRANDDTMNAIQLASL